MRQITLLILILGLLPVRLAEAQDTGSKASQEAVSRRFFKQPVDLWKTGRTSPTLSPSVGPVPFPPPSRESIWAEPIRLPDGRFSIYVPPKQVLEFLEDPTPQTLQAYMAWKKERAEKLRRAMALLRQWKDAERAKNTSLSASAARPVRPEPPAAGRVTTPAKPQDSHPPLLSKNPAPDAIGDAVLITYFHQHG